MARFGEKLRYLRRQRQFTQHDLALHLNNVTQGHISLLEASRRSPSLDVVLQVADVFSVSLDYLLHDSISSETVSDHIFAGKARDPALPRLFGAKLRYLRAQQNMTQQDLAQYLPSWTQSHISLLEADRSEPSQELVLALADLFTVTVDYLLRDTIPLASEITDKAVQ